MRNSSGSGGRPAKIFTPAFVPVLIADLVPTLVPVPRPGGGFPLHELFRVSEIGILPTQTFGDRGDLDENGIFQDRKTSSDGNKNHEGGNVGAIGVIPTQTHVCGELHEV